MNDYLNTNICQKHISSSEAKIIHDLAKFFPSDFKGITLITLKDRLISNYNEKYPSNQIQNCDEQFLIEKLETRLNYYPQIEERDFERYRTVIQEADWNIIIEISLDGTIEQLPNPEFHLPKSFVNLPYLDTLKMDRMPLSSLENLPCSLVDLQLFDHSLINCIDCPPLLNLERLTIGHKGNNLRSTEQDPERMGTLRTLYGLPVELPELLTFIISTEPLRSLEGLPYMPKLSFFSFEWGLLMNYTYLSILKEKTPIIWGEEIEFQLFCSAYGLIDYPEERVCCGDYGEKISKQRKFLQCAFQALHYRPSHIPYEYRIRVEDKNYTYKDACRDFRESPLHLATSYIQDQKISSFHKSRILHEGTIEIFKLLHQQQGPSDPLVIKMAKNLGISLQIDKILL